MCLRPDFGAGMEREHEGWCEEQDWRTKRSPESRISTRGARASTRRCIRTRDSYSSNKTVDLAWRSAVKQIQWGYLPSCY